MSLEVRLLLGPIAGWLAAASAALAALVVACAPAPQPPPPEARAARTAVAAATPSAPVASIDELAQKLRQAGVSLEDEGQMTLEYFDTPAQIYQLGEDSIEAHEFPTAGDAMAAAARVSRDGRIIEQPDGKRIAVEWLGNPHVFVAGRLLVIYVGDDGHVLDALSASLGHQVAGS